MAARTEPSAAPYALEIARIVEACQKVQIEMRIAPATAEPATKRPAQTQPPRGPFRRRA